MHNGVHYSIIQSGKKMDTTSVFDNKGRLNTGVHTLDEQETIKNDFQIIVLAMKNVHSVMSLRIRIQSCI